MTIINYEKCGEFIDKQLIMYTKNGKNPKMRFFQLLYKNLGDFILAI